MSLIKRRRRRATYKVVCACLL